MRSLIKVWLTFYMYNINSHFFQGPAGLLSINYPLKFKLHFLYMTLLWLNHKKILHFPMLKTKRIKELLPRLLSLNTFSLSVSVSVCLSLSIFLDKFLLNAVCIFYFFILFNEPFQHNLLWFNSSTKVLKLLFGKSIMICYTYPMAQVWP